MTLLTALLLVLAPPAASDARTAWGADGHRLVCEIAWRHLTPEAKALIRRLRAGEAGTFAESCTWADEIRGDRPETYNYHFINIPPRQAGMNMARDCGDRARRCAPWAIRHYAVILADSTQPPEQRLEAMKFVGHFVGDLHQPLHAGRPEDLGGNRVMATFFGDDGTAERPMQLHSIWDNGILRRAGLRWPASADNLVAAINTVEVSAWANSDVVGWTNESYRIDEEFVYTAASGSHLGDAYYSRALPIVKMRLRQAGIRLAHILNEAARGRTAFTL